MKTSNLIIDINAKDNVVARASMRISGDSAVVKTAKIKGDNKKPLQVNLLNGFATVLGQLNSAEFVGRVSFIMPESVALRLMGAVKTVKDGGSATDKLYLDWMQSADEKGAGYGEAINAVSEQLEAFLSDEENSLNIVNARQLYRYEITGEIQNLKAGDKVTLANSISEELGVSCSENNFLNGEYTVTTQTIRDRQNNTRVRAFVNRIYKTTVNGEQKSFTASELLSFMGANKDADIAGNSDATNSAISALKLRAINAEQLPRTVVAKIQKVETATDGSLF
jgi:hypothetical protein